MGLTEENTLYFLSTMSNEISDYMCGKYKILNCKSDKEKSNVKHFIKKQIRMRQL